MLVEYNLDVLKTILIDELIVVDKTFVRLVYVQPKSRNTIRKNRLY